MSFKDSGGYSGPPKQLPGANKEIRVDHEALSRVAKAMQKDLDDLNSWTSGSLNHFQDGSVADLSTDELGNYPGGQYVAASAKAAYTGVGSTYSQFLSAYDLVIKAVQRSAQNHANAEDANRQTARDAGRDTQEY